MRRWESGVSERVGELVGGRMDGWMSRDEENQ